MTPYGTITLCSHHFVVESVNPRVRAACNEFSRGLILRAKTFRTKSGRMIKQGKDKVFAAATLDQTQIRYHINHLEEFKKVLYRHRLDENGLITWKQAEPYQADKIELLIKPHFIPTEDQVAAIEYILDSESAHSKLISLPTGHGKTLVSHMAASQQGERACVLVGPKFIDQWKNAFSENCEIDPKRICVIDGGNKGGATNALKSLLWMAEEGDLPYDVIIISSVTFNLYIKAFKHTGNAKLFRDEDGFAVPPYQFFQHIRAGIRIIDEGHEDFHRMYLIDLYTHVNNSVTLSATMQKDDAFIENMMRVAYPVHRRFIRHQTKKYVETYSLHYSLHKPHEFRTVGAMGSYNHIEFEKSILKSREKRDAYFNMVRNSMIYTYDLEYRSSDKCLVYFASIEMCTQFSEFIQQKYPHLEVGRFVENDPFENLMESDISVSTLGSAGTGKDIPKLTTVIMTVAVNSSPSNIQGFGRLRDLNRKDPNLKRRMFFVYFVGDDFTKHVEYHERKVELLKGRSMVYEPRYYGTMI